MPESLFTVRNYKSFIKEQRSEVNACTHIHPQDFVKNKLPALGTGKGVKICVVSNGVPDHPLFDLNISDKANVGPSEHTADFTGHSHVIAGLLAANDLDRLIGLAPDAQLGFVKVSNDRGETSGGSVAAGILWSVLVGAQVVVVPMVIKEADSLVEMAVQKALDSNVLVVMEGTVDCVRPAGTISTSGIIVPAGMIVATYKEDSYATISLSDFTPALVGGIAALLVERVKKADKKGKVSIMTKHIMSLLND